MARILIIGKTPPPIGGVTIHVQRLLGWLDKVGQSVGFYDMAKLNVWALISEIRKHDVIHVNVSNSYLCLFIAFMSKIFGKKVIITYHGNVGRWGRLRNLVDRVWLTLIDQPLVLNEQSLRMVERWNAKVRQVSAFLPPVNDDVLEPAIADRVENFCVGSDIVYCTNAYDFVYDSKGRETYCITQLVKIFGTLEGKRLIVSDPAGSYGEYFEVEGLSVPENVMLISESHSFYAVIRESDAMLRATTTDGDSLSVREALYLGVSVLASNCVERPSGVVLFDIESEGDLLDVLDSVQDKQEGVGGDKHGLHDILKIYSLN